jgi:hypothetical protein
MIAASFRGHAQQGQIPWLCGRGAAIRRKDRAVVMISQAPIFTIHAELADIRHFGTTPYGERRVIDILGGRGLANRAAGRGHRS